MGLLFILVLGVCLKLARIKPEETAFHSFFVDRSESNQDVPAEEKPPATVRRRPSGETVGIDLWL